MRFLLVGLFVVAMVALATCDKAQKKFEEHEEQQQQEEHRSSSSSKKGRTEETETVPENPENLEKSKEKNLEDTGNVKSGEENEEEHSSRNYHARIRKQSEEQGKNLNRDSHNKKSSESLVHEKKEHLLFDKEVEQHLKNPLTRKDRECFAKLESSRSIEFIVDIAPSPTNDHINRVLAESPMALFLERTYRSPSRAYFSAIQLFIDAITLDMKPEQTHACIYDNGRKYFLKGRRVDDVELSKLGWGVDFSDKTRNLKTMWPVATSEVVSNLAPIVENNLGRMTKLALWNRDNGLPTVLSASRSNKPAFSIVISDGVSGAKLDHLVDDVSRTIVFDIGNRRFAQTMSWSDMRRCAGVFTLTAPQQLPLMIDTVRNMACSYVKHDPSSM